MKPSDFKLNQKWIIREQCEEPKIVEISAVTKTTIEVYYPERGKKKRFTWHDFFEFVQVLEKITGETQEGAYQFLKDKGLSGIVGEQYTKPLDDLKTDVYDIVKAVRRLRVELKKLGRDLDSLGA